MRSAQLLALCSCNTVIFVGIGAAVGLLPLHVAQLGGDAGVAGGVLALAYLALALSGVLGGLLSARSGRRKPWLVGAGALAAPLAWALGQVGTIWGLALVMAALWLATGIALAMINILVGLFAVEGARGSSFGLLNLSSGLGLLIGSAISGRIVDRWDFGALFTALAAVYLVVPCAGLAIRDTSAHGAPTAARAPFRTVLAERSFVLLFIASVVGQAANSVIFLSRTVLMDALRFDATAISTAAAIGSLVSLPLPLVFGRLADRWSRKLLLVICFGSTTAGLLVLLAAHAAWQFWLASVLQTVLGVSVVVASAVVSDLFAHDARGAALALLSATPWTGIVIGLSAGGLALRSLGGTPTLLACVGVSVIAVALLLPVATPRPVGDPTTSG